MSSKKSATPTEEQLLEAFYAAVNHGGEHLNRVGVLFEQAFKSPLQKWLRSRFPTQVDDVDEVINDAFMAVLQKASENSLAPNQSLNGLVKKICRNRMIDRSRKLERQTKYYSEFEYELKSSGRISDLSVIERRDLRDRILQLIRRVTESIRFGSNTHSVLCALADLVDQLGYTPSAHELQEHLRKTGSNLSIRQINSARKHGRRLLLHHLQKDSELTDLLSKPTNLSA